MFIKIVSLKKTKHLEIKFEKNLLFCIESSFWQCWIRHLGKLLSFDKAVITGHYMMKLMSEK